MTDRWIAGYLPGLRDSDVRWESLSFGRLGREGNRLVIDVPALDAAQMVALGRRVRTAAREELRSMRVSQIIEIIDVAIARLLDPADRWRKEAEALLPVVTGYDAQMIRLGLDAYLQTFRAPQLHRFVAADFVNPKVLDEFQPAVKGGAIRALGPNLLVHSWAGNVPGLPLWSFVCGLLVKAGNVGKLPSAEPVFASLFARLLAEVHPPIAGCFAVVWWRGAGTHVCAPLYANADAVLAYGGNEAIGEVRSLTPVTTRFLPFGHKLGVALIGRGALDAQRGVATARLAAHDIARYEQQGCYSPHMIYVERGGRIAPREFAQYLAAELASLEHRFPRRALALEEAAAVAAWRQARELSAIAAEPPSVSELIGDARAAWSVAYSDKPIVIQPTATHRTIHVVAVDSLDDAIACVAPAASVLQTAGVAVDAPALYPLAEKLAASGVTRIAALGQMTLPEAGWHHDGRCNLIDLVRFVEIEGSAERASDRLAAYAQEDFG